MFKYTYYVKYKKSSVMCREAGHNARTEIDIYLLLFSKQLLPFRLYIAVHHTTTNIQKLFLNDCTWNSL